MHTRAHTQHNILLEKAYRTRARAREQEGERGSEKESGEKAGREREGERGRAKERQEIERNMWWEKEEM